MRPDRALERLGGLARAEALLRLTSRARLRIAVARGDVLRTTRGAYALPAADEAMLAAQRLSGVLVEDSAAHFHGWETKLRPISPVVAVPRHRRLSPERHRGVRVRFVDLDPWDVSGLATTPVETVLRCAARMPFDEAPARYRTRCLRVAERADGRAANPFESVLRAVSLEVGLDVEPQVWVGEVARPDLLDRGRRLVLEADSFEFHGRRRALRRDCERYNAFVLDGWRVVRFAWEHVMLQPDYVREVLAAFAGTPPADPRPVRRRPAGLAHEAVDPRRSA